MIHVQGLTKQYGGVRAVDGITFTVEPGAVTGFLGPNGAGKSTTMRMILGLDRPTAGSATVAGCRYTDLLEPLRHVGALLDAGAAHPGRTGLAHLRIAARTHGISRARIDEVIDQVGLQDAAARRIRGYSLGMRQRLGIAAALLGDPQVLVLDEPVNGLDLDGVRWIRSLLRGLADDGRTVLVSSHLMSEMQLVADRVVVIGRGRLIADTGMEDLLARHASRVRVRTPGARDLARALTDRAGHLGTPASRVEVVAPHELEVVGTTTSAVGELAHHLGIPVHHLSEVQHSLEDAYLALTEESVVHHGHVPVKELDS